MVKRTKTEKKENDVKTPEVNFKYELKLLDKAQGELFDMIVQKPDANDFEGNRLYVDNVYRAINNCVTYIEEVKKYLQLKEKDTSITSTYNSPA